MIRGISGMCGWSHGPSWDWTGIPGPQGQTVMHQPSSLLALSSLRKLRACTFVQSVFLNKTLPQKYLIKALKPFSFSGHADTGPKPPVTPHPTASCQSRDRELDLSWCQSPKARSQLRAPGGPSSAGQRPLGSGEAMHPVPGSQQRGGALPLHASAPLCR